MVYSRQYQVCQRCDSPPTTTQPNAESGKETPKGGRERVRGEVATFQNSESRALSQQDFGFSLCAVPKFQVWLFRIYVVIQNLSEGDEGLMCQRGNTESV